MDDRRFDDLLRAFGTARRSVLGVSLAALAGAFGLADIDGKGKGKKKGGKKKGKRKKPKTPPQTPPPAPVPVTNPCHADNDCPEGLNCDVPSGRCVCRQNGRCSGCCVSATICRQASDQTKDACGLGGKACEACSEHARCKTEDGACVCDALSTFGCCLPDGKTGRPGTTNDACGKDGDPCEVCDTGETCTAQTCQAATSCASSCAAEGHCEFLNCGGNLLCCDLGACTAEDRCQCLEGGNGCSSVD
jgi:hypothetical protein